MLLLAFALAGIAQGPDIGQKLPSFRLPDQHGRMQTFESVRGPNGAMLVFYRSADWCTFCKSQLVEMQQSLEDLKRRGLGLAAISYDSAAILKHFADRKMISYQLLSDESSTYIRTLGLLNEEVPKNSGFYGIPHPVTYIVDPDGVIQSRVYDGDFRRRATVGSVIGRRTSAAPVPAKRVKLTRSSSDSLVHGGQRFKIRLELEVPPKSHVYAPGVQGYIPLDWKLAEASAFEARPVNYPPSRMLRLDAINETVPIYEGKLVLEREITPADKLPAGELRIEGTLRYQVCDDKQCYVPETVPVSWTLRYEPHDNTRVPNELRRIP
jgi:peroxiredoxin